MRFSINILVAVLILAIFSSSNAADLAKTSAELSQQLPVDAMAIIPFDKPVFGEREKSEQAVSNNPFAIAFYKPTYILPFYFTTSPYHEVYKGNTPDNQKIQSQEFKAQFSFRVPLWRDLLGKDSLLSMGYTQQMYWQVYAKSQYFRETNYQPELFVSKKIMSNFWLMVGAEHQSNGRGGEMERSWNRAYVNAIFSANDFALSVRPWILIFPTVSSDLHNQDIRRYMGHGEMLLAYKWHNLNLSIMTRNNFESKFKRGASEISCSFPITKKVKGYLQYFNGYGQSLIEYNHFTNAFGVGIALSDWI